MGLPVRIVLYATDEQTAGDAAREAFERIARLDQMMSDYRPDSELRSLEPAAGEWTPVSEELFAVVERAIEVARMTDGAFDPSVAPLVALWREARASGKLPDRGKLDAARELVGWQQIVLDSKRRAIRLARRGMRLDLGGIAKGYILQQALSTLRARGVTRALIEAGGDIAVGDAPPGTTGWRIETPGAAAAFSLSASTLANAAIATSGATAQFVEIDGVRYSHVIDPRTGVGVTNQFVARVIAADGSIADALATALCVLGPDRTARIRARFPDVMVSVTPANHTAAKSKPL